MSTSFETRFLEGWARYLAARSIGTWKPDGGAYAATDVAIVLGELPQDPDSAIGLMAYGVDDDATLSDSTIGLQITTRVPGPDPRPGNDLLGGIYDQLHGLHDLLLPTAVGVDPAVDPPVYVVQCYRRSWTSLGEDSAHRERATQNFYVDVHRPSANRT